MANIRICTKCGKIGLDQYDFRIQWYNQIDKYYYISKCKECENESGRRWKRDNYEINNKITKRWKYVNHNNWVSFLKELGYNKCSVCEYNTCYTALEFHHVDKKLKKFGVANFINSQAFTKSNKQVLLVELSNTILLCANCHRELHHNISVNQRI